MRLAIIYELDPSVIQIFVLNLGKGLAVAKKTAKHLVTVESRNKPPCHSQEQQRK